MAKAETKNTQRFDIRKKAKSGGEYTLTLIVGNTRRVLKVSKDLSNLERLRDLYKKSVAFEGEIPNYIFNGHGVNSK